MPQIHLQHYPPNQPRPLGRRGMDTIEVATLAYLLAQRCAKQFSLPERPLTADSFDVIDDTLQGASRQKRDVVIRIDLHNDDVRVDNSQEYADDLVRFALEVVNTPAMLERRGRMTVGVFLLFAHVAWAASDSDEAEQPQSG